MKKIRLFWLIRPMFISSGTSLISELRGFKVNNLIMLIFKSIYSVNGGYITIVLVPDFSETKTIVLVNLYDLSAIPLILDN